MNCEEIDRKRMRLKVLERLRRAGGATLAIGDDGATQITVFRNTKRFRHNAKRYCRG
jgi:hypothetical protein